MQEQPQFIIHPVQGSEATPFLGRKGQAGPFRFVSASELRRSCDRDSVRQGEAIDAFPLHGNKAARKRSKARGKV